MWAAMSNQACMLHSRTIFFISSLHDNDFRSLLNNSQYPSVVTVSMNWVSKESNSTNLQSINTEAVIIFIVILEIVWQMNYCYLMFELFLSLCIHTLSTTQLCQDVHFPLHCSTKKIRQLCWCPLYTVLLEAQSICSNSKKNCPWNLYKFTLNFRNHKLKYLLCAICYIF